MIGLFFKDGDYEWQEIISEPVTKVISVAVGSVISEIFVIVKSVLTGK